MVNKSETAMEDKTFTDDEAALYDRQIRLWGVDAQKRLNSSKILIIGLGGVGAELAKNIILGGVKSVTLQDSQKVTELDSCYQFLVSRDDIGKNRAEASLTGAQRLNPMVEVSADQENLEDKSDKYFANFTVIIATNCSRSQIFRLNRIARENEIKFFAADVFGFLGYIFLDLGEHEYKTEKMQLFGKDKPDVISVVNGISRYITFQDVTSIDWNMDDFAARVKKTKPELFALFIILEFVEKNKRKPNPSTRESDLGKLFDLRDEYVEKNGIPKDRVPDTLFSNVFGEVGPTSAITGGVLAQEVVKAVSHKDPPLVNIFVCNPLDGTGYVENLVD